MSQQDPFLFYEKSKPLELKVNTKKTTAQLVAELRTEHSLLLPDKEFIDRERNYSSRFYGTVDYEKSDWNTSKH